jgi:hypothetical protein
METGEQMEAGGGRRSGCEGWGILMLGSNMDAGWKYGRWENRCTQGKNNMYT